MNHDAISFQPLTAQISLPQIIWAHDHTNPVTDQCDCACAETRTESPVMETMGWQPTAPYHMATDTRMTPLTGVWHLAHQPRAQFVPIVLNDAARHLLLTFQSPHRVDTLDKPTQTAARQLLFTGLLTPTDNPVPHAMPMPSTLTAWLHITNACNLRCTYCYLDKSAQAMTRETGERAIDAIVRSALRHHYAAIKLKYAGGEPLLNLPLILQLHEYAARTAQRNQLGLDAVILSNGTLLTAAMLAPLQAHGIRLMLSLDGIGATHDATRKFADGRGTFTRVARSIEIALAHNLVPEISITLSDHNVDRLPQTMAYVLAHDLPFSLNFFRENDCAQPHDDLRLSAPRLIKAMQQTFRVIQANLPTRSLLGSLIDRASFLAPHQHTCSVGRDYLVIDQRGQIAKCQMQIGATVTSIRAADPLQLVRADQSGIRNIRVDEKTDCQACEWRYWCAGGCPLATFRATGHYDRQSPHCEIYRALFPDVIRLEGLRLLEQAQVSRRA